MRLVVALLFIIAPAYAAQAPAVTFAWDTYENPAGITGFRLYQAKQSGNYAAPAATFPGGTTVTGQIARPATYGRHYFVLTAYVDEAGVVTESAFSNEVTLVIKPSAPHLQTAVLAVLTSPVRLVRWAFAGHRNLRIRA